MGNAPHKLFKDDDMPLDISTKGLVYKATTKNVEDLTGWDRVKKVFEMDAYGEISPELQMCKDMTMLSFVTGAVIGGIGRSRIAYIEFFRSNAHTAYETPMRARVKLQEALFLGFGSGAFRIGWRVAAFSAIYSLSSASLTAYRGKPSILDPVFGGATAGFIYKFHEGPRLTLAGTVFGGIFGLIGGGITSIFIRLFGFSQDDILANNRQLILDRRKKEHEQLQSNRPLELKNRITIDQFHAEILNEELKTADDKSSQSNNVVTSITPLSSKTEVMQHQSEVNEVLKN